MNELNGDVAVLRFKKHFSLDKESFRQVFL